MYVNTMPRYEILSEDAMAVLDGGWRRIVTELGVEFMLPEAVELFRAAGQKVEGEKVFLDPEFILEQVAKAPREFDLVARNPEHSVHIGGDHMVFSGVYGPPFVREGDARRDGKMADFENFVKLSQSFPELDSAGGTIVEPEDRPLDSRHLDMVYALQTLSDKPYMGSVISAENARDTIAHGRDRLRRPRARARPVSISLINCNSPLRWDDRMLSAMLEYNRREPGGHHARRSCSWARCRRSRSRPRSSSRWPRRCRASRSRSSSTRAARSSSARSSPTPT